MKNDRIQLPLLLSFLLLTFISHAQNKLKEKDLIGNWKMIIDVEEALEEAEMEIEKDESAMGRVVLSSVSGLVTGILNEIEIYMEFLPKGELKIMVEAFGEKEVEYSNWKIDEKGRLFIEDTESYSTDEDYWVLQDGILVAYQNKDSSSRENIYMVHLD